MPNTIAVQLVQAGTSTSEGHVREHTVVVDRPEAKGGNNRGPMGGELFLVAVGGCFMSNLLAAIRARSLDVSQVRVKVVGTLAEAPPRYQAVELSVQAEGEDRGELQKLVELADRGCIMTNTVRPLIGLTITLA